LGDFDVIATKSGAAAFLVRVHARRSGMSAGVVPPMWTGVASTPDAAIQLKANVGIDIEVTDATYPVSDAIVWALGMARGQARMI
jgi:hypothetical protein